MKSLIEPSEDANPLTEASKNDPLPYGRQWLDDDDIAEVAEALRSDWLTQGPRVAEFEDLLSAVTGAKYAVAVSNGTAALHVAALAAGVTTGDIGLTVPITFVASANCIAYCGGTPAFVDVDPLTVTMDISALEDACKKHRPKVIIPVDFAGQPAALPEIHRIAQRYGALVIEDAAHSLGASYRSEGTWISSASCRHADLAVLSFHPVKHVTTGEGGAVLTNDPMLHQRLKTLRSHGITKDPERLSRNDGPWYYEQQMLGLNYRITDFQCALGSSQLKKLTAFVKRRRELVARYQGNLAAVEAVTLLTEVEGRRSAYHLMVARVEGGAARRRAVFDYLARFAIRAQVHYIPVHLQPWYRKLLGTREGDYPNAELYYDSCISLPLYPRMANGDVDRVTAVLTDAIHATRHLTGGR